MIKTKIKLAYPKGPKETEGVEIELDLKGSPVRAFLHEPTPNVWSLSHLASGYRLTKLSAHTIDIAIHMAQAWLNAEEKKIGKQELLRIMGTYKEIN